VSATLNVLAGGAASAAISGQLSIVGYVTVIDVDVDGQFFTPDYIFSGNHQSCTFFVLCNSPTGLLTVSLYTGTTHASLVETAALIKGGSSTHEPESSVVLNMAAAPDRIAVIGVNPGAVDGTTAVGKVLSLKVVTGVELQAGSTITVVAFGGSKRHQA
jgi:hypothetical protein